LESRSSCEGHHHHHHLAAILAPGNIIITIINITITIIITKLLRL